MKTDYFRIVQKARHNQPYVVVQMKTNEFIDYKSMAQQYIISIMQKLGS